LSEPETDLKNTEPELLTGALPGPEELKDDADKPKGKPRGRAAVKIKLETLEVELADRIREYIAIPLGMVSPLGMAVLDHRADRTAKALCRVAQTSPRMRKALERFVQGSAVADLGGTVIAVMIAVSVDMHKLEPDSMPARFAGVPEAWALVRPDEPYFSLNGHNPNVDKRSTLFDEPLEDDFSVD
jgi:hypothetical protein